MKNELSKAAKKFCFANEDLPADKDLDHASVHELMASFALDFRKSLLAGLREKVEGLKLGADRPANHVYREGYEVATRDVLALLDQQG